MNSDIRNYLYSSYQEYTGTPSITNIDLPLDIFSGDRIKATELFISYMNEKSTYECLDYKVKVTLSDRKIIYYF